MKAGDLIVCGSSLSKATDHPCAFGDLITLVNFLVKDLTILSTVLTVLVCIFVGFRLMTSGGSTGAREDAKKRLVQVLIGYGFILGAWVIVYTITHALLNSGYSFVGDQIK